MRTAATRLVHYGKGIAAQFAKDRWGGRRITWCVSRKTVGTIENPGLAACAAETRKVSDAVSHPLLYSSPLRIVMRRTMFLSTTD